MISRKIILPVIAVTTFAGFVAVKPAFAQTNNKGISGLVQMIAQKFNLDQTQVQAVFDQYHQQQIANRQTNVAQRFQTRLDNLVKEGKITADQEKLILDEISHLQTTYGPNVLKGLSEDAREAKLKSMRDEVKQWLKDNNIPAKYLYGFGRMGVMMGRHLGWKK